MNYPAINLPTDSAPNPSGATSTPPASEVVDAMLAALPGNPTAALEEAPLQAIREIRANSPAAYALLRGKIKAANSRARLSDLDRLTEPPDDGPTKPLDQLIALGTSRCELHHDADRRAVSIIHCDDRREVWYTQSQGFANWLAAEFFRLHGKGVPRGTLRAAIGTLEAIAVNRASEVEVHLRFARSGDAYYVDVCDAQWRVIEVSASGNRVLEQSPVLFTRTDQMRPLPLPVLTGDLQRLWAHANVPAPQRDLLVAWLIESMRPDTPFPVLEIMGEQGSAKSSTQRAVRALLDPHKVPLRGAPKSVQDIYIASANNWLVSYENLSRLTEEQQDAICTLSTGGGYSTRKLFTNGDEHLLRAKRPVVLNGIAGVATRPDLIERTVRIDAPAIPAKERRTDAELGAAWVADYPLIFTGLLERFSGALKHLPSVSLTEHQRMADFERLGEALALSEGRPAGSFSTAFAGSVKDGVERGLENYGVVSALELLSARQLAKGQTRWGGTVGELLAMLNRIPGADRSNWPKSARGFSDQVRRLSAALRTMGLRAEIGSKGSRGRRIELSFQGEPNDGAPTSVAGRSKRSLQKRKKANSATKRKP